MDSGSTTSEEEFVLAHKRPRLHNGDDEDSSGDESVPLSALINFPETLQEQDHEETELLSSLMNFSESEPGTEAYTETDTEPEPEPQKSEQEVQSEPKSKPQQKSTSKAKAKPKPKSSPQTDAESMLSSNLKGTTGILEVQLNAPKPAPKPILSAEEQKKRDAEIESLAQKIVKACTIPDDKKSLRLLRRFWKAISLEVPKKLPQMGGRNLNFRELLCLVLEHGGWKTVSRKKGGWTVMYQQIAKKSNSGTVVNLRAAYEKFLLPVERALWSTPLGERGWGAPSWKTENEPVPACLICGGRDSNACLECNRCHARFHHFCYETFYNERVSGPHRVLGPESIWVCRHCARWSGVTRCRRTEIDPITGLSVVFAREDVLARSKFLPS